jgi:DNA polymerase-3 subunit gamma/tau
VSYQVLARKWRPRNFQEVVGQQHVLTALSNGLAQNRVHHAYLFSGTRGVGKTTIARILAKSLNCEQGVTATPCGKCTYCQAIDQGRFVDLLEIDAASRTKVDDTRELLDNVQYKPAQGRYKVYLIDEVHMLSKHSFNALLKTLEEPPEYVKFLLATTDPQKLPITVLSRCLQFHLKAILPEEIEKQLTLILQHEQASFEHSALAVIAKAANGSMRDALSLTDQALAFGAGNIEYQAVLKMLGTIDSSHLSYLLHFIASGNVAKVFQKIEEFVHLGADFAKLHQDLAALCHQVALQQMQNSGNVSEKTAIQLLAERLTPEEVQLYYQIALQGYKDYAFAPNGKIAFEMTVMRLLAFKPANYITLDESLLATENFKEMRKGAPSGAIETVPTASAEKPVVQSSQVAAVEPTVVAPVQPAANPVGSDKPAADVREAIIDTAEQSVHTVPQEQIKPVQQLTHSRNMLRSHRLKREQEKKSQATTVDVITEPVVAAEMEITDNDAAEPVAVQKAVISNDHKTGESSFVKKGLARPQEYNKEPEAGSTVVSAQEAAVVDEEPYPFAEQPPIESYLQDNFSETDTFAGNELPEQQVTPDSFAQTAQTLPDAAPVNLDVEAELNEQSFIGHELLEVPTVDIAKYVEDKLTDPWSLVIQQMQLVGLVKLLAKNCVMKQIDQQIVLTLKAEQQHLLNNSKTCEQLQDKLKMHYGNQISMYIEVGNVPGELTPVESEQHIFQQYLDNAKQSIREDSNIKAWMSEYDAKVYENSIIPL